MVFKVLVSTEMEHCDGLLKPTNVTEPIGTDDNDIEAERGWTNSYASVIVMMLYLMSKVYKVSYFYE